LSTFSKVVGSRGKAPRGIFKGEALKLPKIQTKITYANFVNNDLVFNQTGKKILLSAV